jgi:hypothetical protein
MYRGSGIHREMRSAPWSSGVSSLSADRSLVKSNGWSLALKTPVPGEAEAKMPSR